jgi:hypothetical protein
VLSLVHSGVAAGTRVVVLVRWCLLLLCESVAVRVVGWLLLYVERTAKLEWVDYIEIVSRAGDSGVLDAVVLLVESVVSSPLDYRR